MSVNTCFIRSSFEVNESSPEQKDDVLVVPAVFTREGVHNGYLKPFSEIEKAAKSLEGAPVTILHPADETRPVDPRRDPVVGRAVDVTVRHEDRALVGKVVIDAKKTPKWVVDAVKNKRLRGGSLGYWGTVIPKVGVYNGKPYSGVETDLRFDHYAIGLVDGAAKVSDGCGLWFNSVGDDNELPTMGRIKQFFTELVKGKSTGEESLSVEEKTKLMNLEKAVAELSAQKAELEKLVAAEKSSREEIEKKLKMYQEKEAKLEAERKEQLIKKIIDGTDEKPDVYKDFSVSQLEFLVTKLKAPPTQEQPRSADLRGLSPPPVENKTPQKESIGNRLFGKPMGVI